MQTRTFGRNGSHIHSVLNPETAMQMVLR